jgi:predicted site-specific integrase-resolvase
MECNNATKLVSLSKWLSQIGVTSTTGWRWRKKGLLRTVNIYGRLYLSDEAIADFLRRAADGEFALESRLGQQSKNES